MTTEIVTASSVSYFIAGDNSLTTSLTNNAVVEAAEDWIARYCNRWDVGGAHWARDTRVEYIDGELSGSVMLKWLPIESLSAVEIVTGAGTAYTYTLTDLECDGIAISNLSAINPGLIGRIGLRSSSISMWDMGVNSWDQSGRLSYPNFGGGRNRVKVSYTGGYTNIPPSVTLAVKKMAAITYYNRSRDPTVKSTTLGNFSESYGTASDGSGGFSIGDVQSLLSGYRSAISYV